MPTTCGLLQCSNGAKRENLAYMLSKLKEEFCLSCIAILKSARHLSGKRLLWPANGKLLCLQIYQMESLAQPCCSRLVQLVRAKT